MQKEVAEILKGRVLVGHAIHNDLKVRYTIEGVTQLKDESCQIYSKRFSYL